MLAGIAAGPIWVSALMSDGFKPFSWKSVPCTIVKSEIEIKPKAEWPFIVRVEYAYQYAGRSYTGRKFDFAQQAEYHYSHDAYQAINKFPAGFTRNCYVDPIQPARSVLTRRIPGLRFYSFGGIFLLVPMGIALAIFFASTNSHTQPPISSPLSDQARQPTGWSGFLFTICFALSFAGIGGIMFVHTTIPSLLSLQNTTSWTKTPCKIVVSDIKKTDSDDGGYSYRTDVIYQYVYRGQHYYSNLIWPGTSGNLGIYHGGRKNHLKTIRQYPKGLATNCYVNPKQPSIAVLTHQSPHFEWLSLISLIFFIPGTAGAILVASSMYSEFIKRRHNSLSYGHGWKNTSFNGKNTIPAKPVKYLPRYSRNSESAPIKLGAHSWNKFALSLIPNAAWNTFVYTYLNESNLTGAWALLPIPFIIVGIGLILISLYLLLVALNPRPTIEINRKAFFPGESLTLSFHIPNRINNIRWFKIKLIGEEVYRYTHKSDREISTIQSTSIFLDHTIIDTPNIHEITRKTYSFTFPDNCMHSLKLKNNKVRWVLKIDAKLSFLPGIKRDFPLIVLPQGVRNRGLS